jgi:thiol:disulfide interchange protein DsbC
MGMNRLIIFFTAAVFMFSSNISSIHAFSTNGCEADCKKCHTLSNKEVETILKKLNNPNAKIFSIRMSHIKGLWEVSLQDKGQKGIFYVDFSKKFILPGSIIEVNTGSNKTAETLYRIPVGKVNFNKTPLDNAFVMGNPEAKRKVVIFSDPD